MKRISIVAYGLLLAFGVFAFAVLTVAQQSSTEQETSAEKQKQAVTKEKKPPSTPNKAEETGKSEESAKPQAAEAGKPNPNEGTDKEEHFDVSE